MFWLRHLGASAFCFKKNVPVLDATRGWKYIFSKKIKLGLNKNVYFFTKKPVNSVLKNLYFNSFECDFVGDFYLLYCILL